MSDRRLLILDAYDAGELRRLTAEGPWDVLLLGLSESWFRCVTPDLPRADARLRFIDPARFAAFAHECVQTFMLERVSRLPEMSVNGRPLAAELDRTGTSWWYMESSELGPYRTPLVTQLYQLALADGAIRDGAYGEVVVSVARALADRLTARPDVSVRAVRAHTRRDRAPNPSVRYWRQALGAVFAVLAVNVTGFLFRWPRIRPPRGATAIFTLYPAWWSADGRERFFPAPPADVWFTAWFHAPARLWRRRSGVRGEIAERQLSVLQRFVPWSALAGLLAPSRFLRTRRLISRIRKWSNMPFAGVDAAPLVASDVERSLTGGERFQDELLEQAARQAIRELAPRTVLYRAEFQPAERALVRAAQGASRTVGFMHYPFGRNYLSTFNARSGQPLPDALVACGEAGRARLVDAGHSANRIAVCGPQRHPALVERLASARDRAALRRAFGVADATPLFLVTPAIIEADTEALCAALAHAIDGFGPCRLVVRTHPNRPEGGAALARTIAALGKDRIAVAPTDCSLYDALEASDALVTIGSTIAFEAMALGCMPVVFENPSTFAAVSLSDFTDSLFVVRDGAQLRDALRSICEDGAGARQRRSLWAATVARVLGNLTTPLPVQLSGALASIADRPR